MNKYANLLNEFKVFPRIVTISVLLLWWKINVWFTGNWSYSPFDFKDWMLIQYSAMNAPFIGFTRLFIEAWKPGVTND